MRSLLDKKAGRGLWLMPAGARIFRKFGAITRTVARLWRSGGAGETP